MEGPACKTCGANPPDQSFCIVNFPHRSYPDYGMDHMFWYCQNCQVRIASPVPRSLFNGQFDDLPFIRVARGLSKEELKRQQRELSARGLRLLPYLEYLKTGHWKMVKLNALKQARNR